MRILGIDLGTKTMGLAITDNTQTIVSGISNFEFKKNDFKQCYNKIQQIINLYKNEIEKIVIGHPLTITGQKNSWTLQVEKFCNELSLLHTNISVVLNDERFSTVKTIDFLKYELDLKMSKIKKIKDKMSAVTILNDYLEKVKHKNSKNT